MLVGTVFWCRGALEVNDDMEPAFWLRLMVCISLEIVDLSVVDLSVRCIPLHCEN